MWKPVLLAVIGAVTIMDAVAWPMGLAGGASSGQDVLWLDRVTYGPTTATVDRYLKLGRRRFLDEQLHPRNAQLPPAEQAQIDALEISHSDGAHRLSFVLAEQNHLSV